MMTEQQNESDEPAVDACCAPLAKLEETIAAKPDTALLAALGVGFGVGVVCAASLYVGTRQKKTSRKVLENLGRHVLDAVAELAPEPDEE